MVARTGSWGDELLLCGWLPPFSPFLFSLGPHLWNVLPTFGGGGVFSPLQTSSQACPERVFKVKSRHLDSDGEPSHWITPPIVEYGGA